MIHCFEYCVIGFKALLSLGNDGSDLQERAHQAEWEQEDFISSLLALSDDEQDLFCIHDVEPASPGEACTPSANEPQPAAADNADTDATGATAVAQPNAAVAQPNAAVDGQAIEVGSTSDPVPVRHEICTFCFIYSGL